MKKNQVYFAGPIRGERILPETLIELAKYIENHLGYPILNDHVGQKDPIGYQAKKLGKPKGQVLPAEIERYDIRLLDKATHFIAEISSGSTGTGREIEYARTKGSFGKIPAKVFCLYAKDREFYASPFVRGMTPADYPNVTIKSYEDLEEAKLLIKEFLMS